MPLHTFHDVEINSPDFTGNKDLHTVSINDDYNDELFICIKRITGIQYGYAKFSETMDENFDLIRNLKPNFDFFEKKGWWIFKKNKFKKIHILFRDAQAEHYVYFYKNQYFKCKEVYEEYQGNFLEYPAIRNDPDLKQWIVSNI